MQNPPIIYVNLAFESCSEEPLHDSDVEYVSREWHRKRLKMAKKTIERLRESLIKQNSNNARMYHILRENNLQHLIKN